MPSHGEDREDSSKITDTRRKFIKITGSAGVLSGLAGCSGLFGDGGGGSGDSDSDSSGDGSGDSGSGSGLDYGIEPVENPSGDQVRTIDYLTTPEDISPIRFNYAELHAERLRELGFEVEVRAPSIPKYVEDGFVTREFDIYVVRFLDGFDPSRALSAHTSSQLAEGGGNMSGYEDEEYEEMFAEQRTTTDQDARRELVYEMEEKIIDEHPITPILVQNRQMVYNSDRYQNAVTQPEYGLGSFWNFLNIEPTSQGDDSLVFTQVSDINTLNPLSSERVRVERGIIRLIYDRLMRFPSDSVIPEPWMAESVESPDETTRRVTLREGLTWHDGEDVTAEDVQFTFQYGAEQSSAMEGLLEPVDSIEVENDLTVVFNLSEPVASFETRVLAGRNGSILPQHIWENIPEDVDADTATGWNNTSNPVGSGPFQLEDFTAEESLTLTRFDDYFEQPNISETIRSEAADRRTMVRAFEDGSADMIPWAIRGSDLERFRQNDSYEIMPSTMTSIHYACYNMRREPFDVREVRRGFGYSIPKEEAVEVATGGTGSVIHAPISPALETWYNDDIEQFNLDLEAAVSAFQSAGFEWDMDGNIHLPP